LGFDLILAASTPYWLEAAFWYNVLLVLVGLGLVIFVHELGHFAVAKMCGVKCEKFYLGFDIFGIKLCKFTWGETEYGIGALPLGGYVKMLGQEDNPARLREEIERAKAQQVSGELREAGADEAESPNETGQSNQPTGTDERTGDSGSAEIDLAAAEQALFDPRSYLAQSVPKRMAIISAGVIMNVIFALVCAVIAYGMGVFQISCGVGAISPGEAAWNANMRIGDDIAAIRGKPVRRFSEMQQAISVGDIEDGVSMVIQRPRVNEPIEVTVAPDRVRAIPTIGISNPRTTTLSEALPVAIGSPPYRSLPAFQGEDKLVVADGKPIENYADYHAQEALYPEKTLEITVEREAKQADDETQAAAESERVTIEVGPRRMRGLGLEMEMSPVTAVQPDSPAAKAGIRPGDMITAVNGDPPKDPMRLPDQLRRLSEQPDPVVTLTVSRQGVAEPLDVEVSLRRADWYEHPLFIGSAMSVPALGIAYKVENSVQGVVSGSPAEKAGLEAGDTIVEAEFISPDSETLEALGITDYEKQSIDPFEFDEEMPNWPSFIYALQELLPATRVKLTLADESTMELAPEEADDWFNPNRGFNFQAKGFVLQAESLVEAITLGSEETLNALTLVFQFLHKLGTQQVSARALGGPVAIAKIAYHTASKGLPDLLVFLCLISANLAVINFLPIPVLDGGHMVFLAYEGIRGKPPSERVHVTLSYLGLIFILALMVFVLGLDIGCIPRQ
jgi:regulator of sigma E protease